MRNIVAMLLILGLLIVLGPATAQANTILVLTENSSSVLTANIGTVVNVTPDQWDWIPPQDSANLINDATTYWLEPESTAATVLGNWNGFGAIYNGQLSFSISSDTNFTGFGNPSVPNGTTLASHFRAGSTFYDVQFIDNGDVPAVPEPTSLLLLGTGLLGLGPLLRRRIRAV